MVSHVFSVLQLVRQRSLVYNDMALECILYKQYDEAITLLNRAIEVQYARLALRCREGVTAICRAWCFLVGRTGRDEARHHNRQDEGQRRSPIFRQPRRLLSRTR